MQLVEKIYLKVYRNGSRKLTILFKLVYISADINDNLNMYINDHLRMYTSDYALI